MLRVINWKRSGEDGDLFSRHGNTVAGPTARQFGDSGRRRVCTDLARLRPGLHATDGAVAHRSRDHHPLFPDTRSLRSCSGLRAAGFDDLALWTAPYAAGI